MKWNLWVSCLVLIVITLSGCTSQTELTEQTKLTEHECLEKGIGGEFFTNFADECKQAQIIECGISGNYVKIYACLATLAIAYNNETICNEINLLEATTNNPEYNELLNALFIDWFWNCKATVTQNEDFCSNIEDKGNRNDCIKNAGGESILTEEDCKESDYSGFTYHEEECKNIQILECKNKGTDDFSKTAWSAADCLVKVAEGYGDENVCDYISGLKYSQSDYYWYCKASLTGNENYCSYIESSRQLQSCFAITG